MKTNREGSPMSFVSGFLVGAAIGAAVAMLTTPQPGRKTRKRLRKTAKRFQGTATDRFDGLAEELKDKVDEAVGTARARLP